MLLGDSHGVVEAIHKFLAIHGVHKDSSLLSSKGWIIFEVLHRDVLHNSIVEFRFLWKAIGSQ